MNEIDYR